MKNKILIIISLIILTGCAATKTPKQLDFLDKSTGNIKLVYDPLETVNRRIYKFNYYVDQYVLLPVTKEYEDITPGPVRKGISNVIANIGEIPTFINSSLQLKPRVAAGTLGRFAINTTVGILGVFDVASQIGLEEYKEDFGQTLAYYGVKEGPYLILPILGPSNLRDLTGLGADVYTFNKIDPLNFENNSSTEYIYTGLKAVDTRAKVPVGYFGSGSPFEYDLLRRYYTDSRKLKSGEFKKEKMTN